MKYGIELEFFVFKDEGVVPAYKATYNLDGNPVIGELRTDPFDTIEECIFDLKRLLYIERSKLTKKGYNLVLIPEIKVKNDFIRNLRRDRRFTDEKAKDYSEIFSIYGDADYNILPITTFKASLQINFSKDCFKALTEKGERIYTGLVFNYVDLIRGLDEKFKDEIKKTKRTKGIYSIKEGIITNRIEYRSLPNNIDLHSIIEQLKNN